MLTALIAHASSVGKLVISAMLVLEEMLRRQELLLEGVAEVEVEVEGLAAKARREVSEERKELRRGPTRGRMRI